MSLISQPTSTTTAALIGVVVGLVTFATLSWFSTSSQDEEEDQDTEQCSQCPNCKTSSDDSHVEVSEDDAEPEKFIQPELGMFLFWLEHSFSQADGIEGCSVDQEFFKIMETTNPVFVVEIVDKVFRTDKFFSFWTAHCNPAEYLQRIFDMCHKCSNNGCCLRHREDFPEHSRDITSSGKHNPKNLPDDCECYCRSIARKICNVMVALDKHDQHVVLKPVFQFFFGAVCYIEPGSLEHTTQYLKDNLPYGYTPESDHDYDYEDEGGAANSTNFVPEDEAPELLSEPEPDEAIDEGFGVSYVLYDNNGQPITTDNNHTEFGNEYGNGNQDNQI